MIVRRWIKIKKLDKMLCHVIIRMAIAVIGILPITIAYPFFQKYFVKGITIGSVKG